MTNEELALQINKDSPELIPILWERIRRLMYSKSKIFYSKCYKLCDRAGVTVDDIKQECYPAFLEALKAYTGEQEHKFTTFLRYPFQNHVNSLTGQRTEAGKHSVLNNATSLDKPISSFDGDGETTMLDLLKDDNSLEPYYEIEETDVHRIIEEELNKLDDRQQLVIKAIFYDSKTLKATGEVMGVTQERVRQIEVKALRELRKSSKLREMYKEFQKHYEWNRISHFQYSPQYFDLIQKLEEREHQGEYISYGNKQALIYTVKQAYNKAYDEQHHKELTDLEKYLLVREKVG